MEWKWTKGEPYERSRRIIATKEPVETADNKFSKDIEKSAYSSSLNHDENTWEILNYSQGLTAQSLICTVTVKL